MTDSDGRTFRKVPPAGPEREALRAEALAMLDLGKPQRLAAEALGISRGSLRRLVELPEAPSQNGHAKPEAVEPLASTEAGEALSVSEVYQGTPGPEAVAVAPVETAGPTVPFVVAPMAPSASEAPRVNGYAAVPDAEIARHLAAAAVAIAEGSERIAFAHLDYARGRAAVEGLDIEARIADVLGLGTGGDGDGGSIDASIGQAGKPVDPDLMYRVGALFGFLVMVAIGALIAVSWTRRTSAAVEAEAEAEVVAALGVIDA
jgi:hypothetical protein